jgi:hypothetical protein
VIKIRNEKEKRGWERAVKKGKEQESLSQQKA